VASLPRLKENLLAAPPPPLLLFYEPRKTGFHVQGRLARPKNPLIMHSYQGLHKSNTNFSLDDTNIFMNWKRSLRYCFSDYLFSKKLDRKLCRKKVSNKCAKQEFCV
jgi:hypothetical protein